MPDAPPEGQPPVLSKNSLELGNLFYYCVDKVFTGDFAMGQDVWYILHDYEFTWDSDKAESNIRKHDGVSFEEACEVFFDPWYHMEEDTGSQGERRWVFVGYSAKNRPLCVVAAEHGDESWRIISARKLGPEERRRYEKEDDTY